jgi:hypothetical protein
MEASPLLTSHGRHTATLLADGRVLIAGSAGVLATNAETYEPLTDTWTLTAPMTRDRQGHTATRLGDGRVLVVGGEIAQSAMDWFTDEGTAEIFDPETNRWTATGSLVTIRGGFTATLLATGEVLVVGGVDGGDNSLASAELYDPVAGRWRAAASMWQPRFWHTATGLPDGNVLIVGGWADDWDQTQVAAAEIYDWKSGSWMPAGTIEARGGHTATLLDDGTVLVAGGYSKIAPPPPGGWYAFFTLDSATVFDPAKREWHDVAELGTARFGHLAAPLRGGGALIVQGTLSYDQIPNVKYRDVREALKYSESTWVDIGVPPVETAATSVTRLDDGTLLFVGEQRTVLYRY